MRGKFLSTTAVILFLIPNVNFGQAPYLGTSYGFALFTRTLDGQKHMPDGASATAATDVPAAFGYMAALPPLDVLDVGSGGQIPGPGSHFTGSGKSAAIKGTLTQYKVFTQIPAGTYTVTARNSLACITSK